MGQPLLINDLKSIDYKLRTKLVRFKWWLSDLLRFKKTSITHKTFHRGYLLIVISIDDKNGKLLLFKKPAALLIFIIHH